MGVVYTVYVLISLGGLKSNLMSGDWLIFLEFSYSLQVLSGAFTS